MAYFDLATNEFWFDFSKLTLTENYLKYALMVSIDGQPDVTPTLQFINVNLLCSDFHQDWTKYTSYNTEFVYDVTEAAEQIYSLDKIEYWPTCHNNVAGYILDDSGNPPSFASTVSNKVVEGGMGNNQLTVNASGTKMWSWLTTPITLYWYSELEDGSIIADMSTITVTGESNCTMSSFPAYPLVTLAALPDAPGAIFAQSDYLDIETSDKAGTTSD